MLNESSGILNVSTKTPLLMDRLELEWFNIRLNEFGVNAFQFIFLYFIFSQIIFH